MGYFGTVCQELRTYLPHLNASLWWIHMIHYYLCNLLEFSIIFTYITVANLVFSSGVKSCKDVNAEVLFGLVV